MKRVFAHIGFSVALALLVLCLANTKIVICLTIGLAIVFIASLCLDYFRQNVTVPLCFGAALFACVLFLVVTNFVVAPQLALNEQEKDISFYITDVERVNDKGEYVYTGFTTRVANDSKRMKIRLKSDSHIDADYYDIINADVKFYSIGERPFDSYGYWGDGIYLTAKVESYSKTNDRMLTPFSWVPYLQTDIRSSFMSDIKDDEGGFATALVTGNKDNISAFTKSYFAFAGISHVMAVSGLHLSIVAGLLYLLLRKLRAPNAVIIPSVLGLILLYMCLAGFSKSIVRAGIMMISLTVAPLFKSRGDALNSLGLALFVMCLNPFAVTDIGMQLSILSTLAIILSNRIVSSRVRKALFDEKLTTRLASKTTNKLVVVYLTLFVIVFTMPIIYINIGYFSVASVVSNLIIMPFCSLALVLCIVYYLLSLIGIGGAFAVVLKHLLGGIISATKHIASYSNSTMYLDDYVGLLIAGVFLIIGVCFIYKNGVLLKKGIVASVILCVMFCIVTAFLNSNSSFMLVTKDGAVAIKDDDCVVVAGVNSYDDYSTISAYLSANGDSIDVLVADGSDFYSTKLSQQVVVNTVVTDELSQTMLDNGCYKNIKLVNNYTVDFGNGRVLDYKNDSTVVALDDLSISLSNAHTQSEISINQRNKNIVDKYGSRNLSNGTLLYRIDNDGYSARRIKQWQE